MTVDERRSWMFSGPGRSYHMDREEARKLGFPNIVVQGMMSTCFVAQVMQDAFGRGWVEGGRMSVKLTNVLSVDETVTSFGKIREEVAEGDRTRVHCDVCELGGRCCLFAFPAMPGEDLLTCWRGKAKRQHRPSR